MVIFIDTNIYLDYYKNSGNVLVSLEKLERFIRENKRAKLLLPQQIRDEFLRNRNNVIKKSLKAIRQTTLFSDYSSGNKCIVKKLHSIKKQAQKLTDRIEKDFSSRNSKINKTIKLLFSLAETGIESNELFARAHKRIIKGNPPGKNGSIGDAIVWEIILEQYFKQPIYIVSRDCDWKDELDKDELKSFLLNEWREKSKRKIQIFSSVSNLLNKVAESGFKVPKRIVKQENKALRAETTYSHPIYTNSSNDFVPIYTNPMNYADCAYSDLLGGSNSFNISGSQALSDNFLVNDNLLLNNSLHLFESNNKIDIDSISGGNLDLEGL